MNFTGSELKSVKFPNAIIVEHEFDYGNSIGFVISLKGKNTREFLWSVRFSRTKKPAIFGDPTPVKINSISEILEMMEDDPHLIYWDPKERAYFYDEPGELLQPSVPYSRKELLDQKVEAIKLLEDQVENHIKDCKDFLSLVED